MLNNSEDNSNNGLITKIWGPHLWEALHAITFGFPKKPTDEQRENYKRFFTDVGNVMPCVYCRNSYKGFIADGNAKLTDDVFIDRDSITRWLYRLHQEVNNKLSVDYNVAYEEVVDKYESYRAKCVTTALQPKIHEKGCTMPLNLKAESYKKGEGRCAPVVTADIANKFRQYALMRNFDMGKVLDVMIHVNKTHKNWCLRDKMCWKIIKKMRIEGIPSIEKTGKYKGLPTREELKLMSLLSTTIPKCDFNNIIEKLNKLS
jgi:hypothetical protein